MIFLGGLGTTRTMWRAQLKTFPTPTPSTFPAMEKRR